MSDGIESLLAAFEEYTTTADYGAQKIRLSLADLILAGLDEKGWSQSRLAFEADVKPPFINRVIHADANCTIATMAKLLHALGMRAELMEIRGEEGNVYSSSAVEATRPTLKLVREATSHGEEEGCAATFATSETRKRTQG